ncbi:MAG: hypothetical protein HYT77_01545 [Deltaproteobacteria bacterium]|nr:hypothetical protein [Deltaproteobacteria bacterium]
MELVHAFQLTEESESTLILGGNGDLTVTPPTPIGFISTHFLFFPLNFLIDFMGIRIEGIGIGIALFGGGELQK